MITVWECQSVDGKQCVQVIHAIYPDDFRYQHEYQKIVFRGKREDWKGIP